MRMPRVPLYDLSKRVTPAEVIATRAAQEAEKLRQAYFHHSANRQGAGVGRRA